MKHAALYESCGIYYIYIEGKATAIETPNLARYDNAELLLSVFERFGVDVLWIFPVTEFSKNIGWSDFDRIDRERFKVFPEKPNGSEDRPAFVSIRRKSNERFETDRYLSFPEHAEWSAHDQGKWFLPTPYALGYTIQYLEKEFECSCMWGPGNMGMQVLKRTFRKKGWKFANTLLTDQLREIINQSMFRPIWKRFYGLSEDQKKMKYIHGYDKNGQYLGAAQQAFLGNGTPYHTTEIHLGQVGFWRYEIVDVSNTMLDGYDLPCPLDVNRSWASSDLLLAARFAGVEFILLEGYVWPEHGKYLENWSKEMWAHRANLRDKGKYPNEIPRENAEGTAKAAANMMMGRLARQGSRELYKPDWNQLIIHKAIANQMYSLNKWQRDGVKPVLVSTDSFWVISDEVDESKAVPGILEHCQEQRGYKHIGTLELTDEIIDMFDTHSPEEINGYLKKGVASIVESI